MKARPASREVARQALAYGRRRRTVLLLHVVAGGTWFGLDVAMAVLVFTAIGSLYARTTYEPLDRPGAVPIQASRAM
jgi:hypothetical protein